MLISQDTKYKLYVGVAVFLLAFGVPIAEGIFSLLGM